MTFTEGTLLLHEVVLVARLFARENDWSTVREEVMEQNLLQKARVRTAKTVMKEVVSRLKLLTDEQRGLLITGTRYDQEQMAWLAVCKRYVFIHEFASNVIREKYLRLDFQLSKQDYEAFFAEKAMWEENIDRLTDSTRAKLRSNLFRMMKEAGIISTDNAIQPAILSKAVTRAVANDEPGLFAVFPVTPSTIMA